MPNKLAVGLVLSVLVSIHAESQTGSAAYNRGNIAEILSFEVRGSADLPAGWWSYPQAQSPPRAILCIQATGQ